MIKNIKLTIAIIVLIVTGTVLWGYAVLGAVSTLNNTPNPPYATSTFNNPIPVVTNGLMMWLTMDGQNTTIVSTTDSSPLPNYYANRIGGAGLTDGRIGSAFYFDGNTATDDDYLLIPSQPVINTSTIMMWFRLDTSVLPSNHRMMWSGSVVAGNATYFSNTNNGAPNPFVSYKIGASQRTLNAAAPTVIGKWTHMAVSWDGSFIRMYIDGVLSSTSGDFSGTGSLIGVDSNPAEIGAFLGIPTGWAHQGAIDDFRIYNRALSAAEIMAITRTDTIITSSTP